MSLHHGTRTSVLRRMVAAALFFAAWKATPAMALSVGAWSPIVSDGTGKDYLQASGNLAVWESSGVWMYNFATGSETLVNSSGNSPSTDGTHISYIGGDGNVWVYDVTAGTTTQITNGESLYNSDISGSWVVYLNVTDGFARAKNMDTGVGVTLNPIGFPGNGSLTPRIDGTWVVYSDNRTGNYDIYAYDLSTMTESRITSDSTDENYPQISGSWIVFQKNYVDRNGTNEIDIYGYDLSTGTTIPICTSKGQQFYPRIDGTLVMWADSRKFPYGGIYLYDLATSSQIQVSQEGGMYAIAGGHVLWSPYPYGTIYAALVQ